MHTDSSADPPGQTPWWVAWNQTLTPERSRYALAAGVALWVAWGISAVLGPGVFDLSGQLIGADFMQYYAGGHALLAGESARLYDFAYFEQLEIQLVGDQVGPPYFYFITPPFLAWLFVPLSLLPYLLAFAIWSAAGLGLLGLGLGWLDPERRWISLAWALAWFPVFASVSFGQNALLSFGVLALVYLLWRQDRRFLAGLALSLIMYKPQLSLGVGLLWLLGARRDWPALVGVSLGSLSLAIASFAFLPEASHEYVRFATEDLPTMSWGEGFPLWHAHSLRGFWLLLLPFSPVLCEVLTFALAAGGVLVFVRARALNADNKSITYALAIVLTLWITPHAMIYDWSLLLIPAVLLWRERPQDRPLWRVLFALIWITTFIAGPLVIGQQKVLPFALQVTLPALAFAALLMVRAVVAKD